MARVRHRSLFNRKIGHKKKISILNSAQYIFGLYASIDAYNTCVRPSTVPPGQPDDKRYITDALSRYTYVL